MKFLILHGSFGSPNGNWFPYLKQELEKIQQEVLVPQLPVDDWDKVTNQGKSLPTKNQSLTNWMSEFEKSVLPWVDNDPIVIAAHSLSPLFILHVLSKHKLSLDAAIFVSPFLNLPSKEDVWQIGVANSTFYEHSFDYELLKNKLPKSYVLYSATDPYVPADKALEFAKKLDSSVIEVKGAKHLSSEFKDNQFPLVLELCKSRLQLSEYQ